MQYILEEISLIYPDAKAGRDFNLKDNGDGKVYIKEWKYDQPEPTDYQLELKKVQADIIRQKRLNQSKREKLYPAIGDQLDILYKTFKRMKDSGISVGPDADEWISTIKKIKNDYPTAV